MLNTAAGKEELGTDACAPAKEPGEGLRVTPIGWEATREILKPLFDDRKHWIIVAHIAASPLVTTIERKYYLDEKNSDFTLITAFWRGQGYVLVAARKRWMQGYQLASLLKQWTSVKVRDAEMATRDLFISAPDALTEAAAVDLAAYLFDKPAELAIKA